MSKPRRIPTIETPGKSSVDHAADELQRVQTLVKQTYVMPLKTKNMAQELYYQALMDDDVRITFGVGPAGTGKTTLAVLAACERLVRGEVSKIYLTRPIVDADEDLGFLPGTFDEKTEPYMIPLFQAFRDIIGNKSFEILRTEKVIEIVPLAFMRGRNLKNCVSIMDESQNCTYKQLKMYLTRMATNCRMYVTGDPDQTDLSAKNHAAWLESGKKDGLTAVLDKMAGKSERIHVTKFHESDAVRDSMTSEILKLLR